ncbi:MAG: hypothetical protein HW386_1199 [Gammaproteobacteria bacterium]|nr:hypothetical protein [Gammaproteobacteria bacterium]
MKKLFTELSDAEIEQLDNFLLGRIDADDDTEDKDEGVLSISELDGLFTALVSGPDAIQPSQWLPVVWGDFEPVWESMQDSERVLGLMMRHMNSIAAMLREQPDNFEPLFMERVVADQSYTIVDEWCEGYSRGVELAAPLWEAGGREMNILLTPILAFASQTDWRGHDFVTDEIEILQNAITPNVRLIHAYWRAWRDESATAPQPERSVEHSVGRNDLCPCGSGKLYKKCCLH